jgi:hypothetical protein
MAIFLSKFKYTKSLNIILYSITIYAFLRLNKTMDRSLIFSQNIPELLTATMGQVNRELHWINEDIEINEDFDLFFKNLKNILSRLSNTQSQKVSALLYRIDLEETLVYKSINDNIERAPEDVLAELIVKKALQKIVIRRFYENSPL